MTVLRLGEDGRHPEVASAGQDEPLEAGRPFPVRIVPADLLAE